MVSTSRPKKSKPASTETATVELNESDRSDSIRIIKIKISEKEASLIKYERSTKSGEVEAVEHPFYGAIHPDFEDALNALMSLVVESVGLIDALWLDNPLVRVSGVSIKHDGMDMGVTVTAQRKLEDGAVVINTPYMAPDNLDFAEQRWLQDICKEAIACINGKRAQMNLFSNEESDRQ